MYRSVTIISGARPEFRRRFEEYAIRKYEAQVVDVIIRPGADVALAHDEKLMPREMQFVMRDIIQTQLEQSRVRLRSDVCIIICAVTSNRENDGFETCSFYVQRAYAQVASWRYFPNYLLACLTPNGAIESIDRP